MGSAFAANIIEVEPDQLVKYDENNKIDLTVTLVLSEEFKNYSWDAPTGRRYTLMIGESLSKNAKLLCDNAFKKVITSSDAVGSHDSDAVLIPEVVLVDKTQAAFGPQMVEMEIQVLWTLKNREGKIIWIDTIKGFGHEKMGGPFSFDKNTKKQINMAMGNMFKNTHEALFIAERYFKAMIK
jgi:hypothetical protein